MPDRTATGGAIIKLRHYRRPAGRARPAGRESSAAARLRRLARSLLAMRGRPSRVRRDGGRSWRCLPVAHGFEVEHLHPLLALDPPVITATYETARGIEEEDKAELRSCPVAPMMRSSRISRSVIGTANGGTGNGFTASGK